MLRWERPPSEDPEVDDVKWEFEPWKLQLSIMTGRNIT